MRAYIAVFVVLNILLFSCCNQNKTNDRSNDTLKYIFKLETPVFDIKEFNAIPSQFALRDRAYLIDKIIPANEYKYWECVYKEPFVDHSRGRIIVYNGDSLNYSAIAKKINPNAGFFVECAPLACYSYIVGVRGDKTTDLINTEEKLQKFIGHIDNLEEVILSAKTYGYWYDADTIIGGAYKEREWDYLLFLLEYSSSPVTYTSVKAILAKDGYFRVIDKTIYKQTDVYLVE